MTEEIDNQTQEETPDDVLPEQAEPMPDVDEMVEQEPKKKKRRKRKSKTKTAEKKEDGKLKLRALRNFMLWDGTMAREGEVVDVPETYAKRLLTHTPKAFERA
jgi:hypothetical protein